MSNIELVLFRIRILLIHIFWYLSNGFVYNKHVTMTSECMYGMDVLFYFDPSFSLRGPKSTIFFFLNVIKKAHHQSVIFVTQYWSS